MALKDDLLAELDNLINEGQRLDASYRLDGVGNYWSELPEADFHAFYTSSRSSIARIAGKHSEFYATLPQELPRQVTCTIGGGSFVAVLTGALRALRASVEAGLLVSLENRLRANVYDDFLVQAEALLERGYHVVAIVLIGGVLEDHLRKLCDARSLTWKGDGSLSKYNDALYAADLYAKTVLSRVQAIAHVRNEAAHGNGAAVKREDVDDALAYVRHFVTDYPA
jgi:hypothetical protein